MDYKLPVKYHDLHWIEKQIVREQYIKKQNGKCMYCNLKLTEEPPKGIRNAWIDWGLFPPNFTKYPIHLQHNHDTGMTEGAVHALCNAYMWQYERK